MKRLISRLSQSLALLLFFCVFPVTALATPELPTVADTTMKLTEDCQTTEEKAMAIYRYLCGNFQYDYELRSAILTKKVIVYTPDPQQVLLARKGICYDLAVLFADMLHSQGYNVPQKLNTE